MDLHQVRQVDARGVVLSEQQIVAQDYGAVLRQLKDVSDRADRIEVYDHEGKKAGQVSVDYWRQKIRQKGRRG